MRHRLFSDSEIDPDYGDGVQALNLTGQEADQTFDALSSPTSREVLESLYDEPSTPPQLAEKVDTSPQNVHYHLEKLESADLIEANESTYSSRGIEMDIYEPTSEAVVLLTGRESTTEEIRRLLGRFLLGLGLLTILTVVIDIFMISMGGGGPVAHDPGPGPSSTTGQPLFDDLFGIRWAIIFVAGLCILLAETWVRYKRMTRPH